MSGIVNVQNNTTERNRLARSILIALRELIRQTEPDHSTYDLAAYIAMALGRIFQIVESATFAWEKKGYWVKADRFRLEWEWTEGCRKGIESALQNQDWGNLADILSKVANKLSKVKVSPNSRVGKPWLGAWTVLKTKTSR